MLFRKKCVLACSGLLAALWLVSCGGNVSGSLGGGSAVTVTASSTTVDGTNAITLTASVANDKNAAGVTWSVTGGGTLSNTTTTGATYTAPAAGSSPLTVTITATSVADTAKSGAITITVPAKPSITTAASSLNSTVGASYNVTLQVTGGITPYTWTVTSGSLPSCLTLNASTGAITGTITAACAGNYTVTFTATDSGSPTKLTATAQLSFTITAATALSLPATVAPATATDGVAYVGSVAATGGVAPLTYSITTGSLPAGLTLNPVTGAITGTPTAAAIGVSNFTVKVVDGFGDTPATQAYSLTVNPGAATHFAVAATTSTTISAGGTIGFSVTALDVNGVTATGYLGTVKFTSSDAQAVLPGNATLTNGVGSFQATLKTSGTQSITATDTVTLAVTGSLAGITVNSTSVSKISVSAPSTATAGTAISVTVTAQDTFGNTVPSYSGTVLLTSSDSAAVLPAFSTLTSGTKVFSVTLKTAGTATVTATDTVNSALTGVSGNITVNPAAASTLVLQAPVTTPAGAAINVSVTAKDSYGNTATGYSGTLHFSSTDSAAVLPGNSTLTNGVGSFQVTLKTSGTQTVTATDSVTSSITGSTGSIAVTAASLTHLVVSAPSSATAGTAISFTVTAEDNFNNQITSYSGTVHFTSTDSSAVLPANSTLTNGTGTFQATLKTAGTQTITATDTGNATLTGTSANIAVSAAAVSSLTISAPLTATAGVAVSATVTAKDTYGNTATGYTGTVHFTSSDGGAVLPANSTLTNGTGSFQATLKTAGNQTITATDTVNAGLAATTSNIAVSAATATHLQVSAPSTATAGVAVTVSVTALDAFGNVGTGYAGTVHFTSTDGSAVLPANSTLTSGSGSFQATLKTALSQTITATDTVTSSINGVSGAITVSPAAAAKLMVSAPSAATTNTAFNLTVTAQDAFNNPVTSYAGTVHFTSTDGTAVLPADSTLTSGSKVFSATLKTNGSQTISATDTVTSSINGTSGSINVSTALIINQNTLPPGNVGITYSQTLTASGGSGTGYTFSESTTTLSTFGLSLASNGAITGSPTQSGIVNFTAKVTDSASATATQNLAIQVFSGLSLPAANSFPAGYTGVAYNGSIAGTGGSTNLLVTITSALSPSNGTLAANVSGLQVNITGTPSTAKTESLTVKLTDTSTNNFISQTYTFSISTPTAPSLPSANPGAATVNQSYSGSITATGGVGPNYTWTINGSPIASDGTLVSVGNGLSVSDVGGALLTVSGTPTSISASPGVQFTAQVKDNTTNLTSSLQTYTIVVNSAGSTVAGTLSVLNVCGNTGFTPPPFTLSLDTTPTQQVQSNLSGNYSFSAIPNGTYTITPSYAGPSGSSAVFYPASQTIIVNNGTATVPNFNVALGYTVSGTISYTGAHTGQIYVDLVNSNCPGDGGFGTSISSTGNYAIRGVTPGSYSVISWMDPTDLGLGQGYQNISDPSGSTTITLGTNNLSAPNVILANPTIATPTTPTISAVFAAHQGVVIAYKPAKDTNGIETGTSYDVAWSTSPALSGGSLASVAGTYNYKAIDKGTVWILNNNVTGSSSFSDGTTYYFQARARNSAGNGAWVVYGGATPTAVTVNPPSGAATISGNVTIPAGITVTANAKLYVGFFSDTAGINATTVNSPAVGSSNPFTLNVPTGTWQFFAILDQNNDGEIDTGDVSNTRDATGGPPTVTISGSNNAQDVSLSNASVISVVQTSYFHYIYNGGTNSGYSLTLGAGEGAKLPVSLTLTAASNPNIPVPMDISNYCPGCGNVQFQIVQPIYNDTPAVGDTYTFTVNYSDGTTDTNVTAAVTGWNGSGSVVGPSNLMTNLLPSGTTGPSAGTRTQPTFTWTYPSGASTAGDYYRFSLCCSSNSDIWDVPAQNSNSNGFLYSDIPGASLTWNVDPTGSGSTVSVSPLPSGSGQTYSWSVTATDANGNQGSSGTWYQP